MVLKLLRTIALLMRNFIANLVRILGICKDFAGNRVNKLTALSFKNAERIRKSCYFIALTNGLEIDV